VREILLIFQVLIGSQKQVKTFSLGHGYKIAVLDRTPAPFVGSGYLVVRQVLPERNRHALVKEYLHATAMRAANSNTDSI